jgi:fibronectin-binding autotransporter adhesin
VIELATTAAAPLGSIGYYYETTVIDNAGVIRKTADVDQGLSVNSWVTGRFSNSGTVNVTQARLSINGDGTDTGRYTVAGGASLEFASGTRTMAALSNPTGGGTLRLTGASLTLATAGATTLAPLVQSNGTFTLSGTGNLTLPSLTQTGGTLGASTPGSISVGTHAQSGGTATFTAPGGVSTPALALTGGALTLSAAVGALGLPSALVLANSTLTLNSPVSLELASLTLTTSTLAGSAPVVVTDNFVASGTSAAVQGSGSFTTRGTSTVEFSSAGGLLTLGGGRTWTNEGTIDINGDDAIRLGSGACCTTLFNTLDNRAGATINLNTSAAQPVASIGFYYEVAEVRNAGTINKPGDGTQTLSMATWVPGQFVNSGTVNVAAGRLVINGNGSDVGQYLLGATAELEFSGGTRTLSSASNPAAGAALRITDGSVTLGALGTTTLLPLVVTGGSFSVSSTGNLSAPSATLSGGTLSLTASGTLSMTR